MESRLAEKLKLAGGVVARQHAKIEKRAEDIIAREQVIARKTDQAFAPHELMLDDAMKGLDELERQLAGVSNNPLQTSQDDSHPGIQDDKLHHIEQDPTY